MNLKNLAGYFAVLLIILLPVFGHLSELPIQMWDESRLAVKAFEMNVNGNWIVPTFLWEPDMWSTKPPLLIWLMTISIKILGANELAIRLPTALSAVATCMFMYWFLQKRFKNILIAVSAPAFLIICSGYTRLHGIRTGDYDPLLTMFTTMFLVYFYLYLKELKPKHMLLTAIMLSLACLTKGVPALIFMPAMLAMAIYHKRLKHILTSKEFYAGLILFLFIVPGYYLLREHYNPGYIAAVVENELGGRFMNVVEGHHGTWEFYFRDIFNADAFVMLLAVSGMNMAFISHNKEIRHFSAYSTILALSFITILSFSKTKLNWYTMPTYPLLAMLAGIAFNTMIQFAVKHSKVGQKATYALLTVSVVAVYGLTFYSLVHSLLLPPENNWDRQKAVITYIKHGMAGKKDLSSTGVLSGEYQQDLIWYDHVCEGLSFKNFQDFKKGDKVIAREDESARIIEKMYECKVADNYLGVRVYDIYGWKPNPEADTLK